jgi:ankyrin repeat protein
MTYEDFLVYSARIGEYEDVKFCIEEKIDLETKEETGGNTALHMACANNHIDIVKLLLKHGANPNSTNNSNNTPLRNIINIIDMIYRLGSIKWKSGDSVSIIR